MKLWKGLNNRGRILALLLASLVLLNLIVLVTSANLKSFSGSFASMYNDRLIPSTDIAQILEYSYKDRLFLEDIIFRDNRETTRGELERNHQLLEKTFKKYKKTYFTEEETEHAAQFKNALKTYRGFEEQILNLLEEGKQQEAEALFTGPGNRAFQQMIHELHLLSGIQVSVGRLLYEQADNRIKIIKMVAYFSLFVSLLIAIQLLKVLGIKPLNH